MSSGGCRPRIRAHRNPLSSLRDLEYPVSPAAVSWPGVFEQWDFSDPQRAQVPTIADVGCGFGGFLSLLSPMFPNELVLGLEIRPQVVDIVRRNIITNVAAATTETPYNNMGVVLTNFMRYCPNFFARGQLQKIFFLFQDPHFKKKNIRRRVVSVSTLDMYAYSMADNAIAYTITDVKDLHEWTVQSFTDHPLFVPIGHEMDDPVIQAMCNTNEGQKVSRAGGEKFIAVFKRIPTPFEDVCT